MTSAPSAASNPSPTPSAAVATAPSAAGHARDYAKYLGSLLLFGSNGIVASMAALPSHELVLLRTLIGALTLVGILMARRAPLACRNDRTSAGFVALSGVALGLSWMFLFEAYRQVGVQVASLAYYCGPIVVMAVSPLLFHERLGAGKLAGFAAVLAGIVLVNGTAAGNGLPVAGLACGGAAALMYAAMVVFNKKGSAITGLENAAIQLVSAFATAAAASLLMGAPLVAPAAADLPAVAMLGLVNTALGCYLYFGTIGRLPVQTVAVCGYLEPLSAVVLSALILGESLAPLQVLGAALIVGGAVACELAGRMRRARPFRRPRHTRRAMGRAHG